ncbi:MSC_0624 family F1-like ATPase-associated membrane protein [Mycoplasmopsis alligatoris]|uniref:Uncharacterized protein n=1 Tax=Mycoplasmopsis alligatoris A21JP2 TaxID=747682 RepID=D4XVL5_9BACT|nr:hypothetical protein [Mycoplasmopsis alligatoris]EFF41601.1 hypothetical protein MALL_0564 [Mycoplasmopsis alligatoris A21JP2]
MKLKTLIQNFEVDFKQKLTLINILKAVLLVALFAFNMALLITFEKSFFRFNAPNNSLYYVLYTNSNLWYQTNIVSITSSLIFYLIIVSTLLKNSMNLTESRSGIKKYLPFYFIYLFFSISVMSSFFLLDKIHVHLNSLYVVIIVSVVYIMLNVFNIIVKKLIQADKIYPMEHEKSWLYIAMYIFRVILYTLIALLIHFWTDLHIGNKAIDESAVVIQIKNFFQSGTATSIFIFAMLITVMIVLLIGANINTIYKLLKRYYVTQKFSTYSSFLVVIIFSLLIWAFIHYGQIKSSYQIMASTPVTWPLLVFPIILFALLVYVIVTTFKPLVKNQVLRKILNSCILLFAWLSVGVLEAFSNSDFWISNTHLILAILVTIFVIFRELRINKTSIININLLLLTLVFIVIYTFIAIFKIDLLNQGNYSIYIKYLGLKLNDIFMVLICLTTLALVIYNSVPILTLAISKTDVELENEQKPTTKKVTKE